MVRQQVAKASSDLTALAESLEIVRPGGSKIRDSVYTTSLIADAIKFAGGTVVDIDNVTANPCSPK